MKNKIKWFFQRLFRGYSDYDVLNLNLFIVEKLQEPLKKFIRHQEERGRSLPRDFSADPASWLVVLKKIESAFYLAEKRTKGEWEGNQEEHEKREQEGFELFGRYLKNFWDN